MIDARRPVATLALLASTLVSLALVEGYLSGRNHERLLWQAKQAQMEKEFRLQEHAMLQAKQDVEDLYEQLKQVHGCFAAVPAAAHPAS